MEIYRIALFGHRDLGAHLTVEEGLFIILRDLLQIMPYVEIYVGRNGEFDVFSASVIKRVQNRYGKESVGLSLILPYYQKDIEHYEKYYDSVIIPECVQKTYPKGAITKRNRWMVEECDLIVCYVERERGGAYCALKYAKKLGKKIINLATEVFAN